MKYPFLPEYLDALPERIADVYRELEVYLLAEIAATLSRTFSDNDLATIQRLLARGIPMPQIIQALANATRRSEQAVKKLLEKAERDNENYYRDAISAMLLVEAFYEEEPVDEGEAVEAIEAISDAPETQAIVEDTENRIDEINRNMGFWTGDRITAISDTFRWAVNDAIIQVRSGAFSYSEAIARTTRRLADGGLSVVDYPTGHRDRVDVAVRRAVLTGVGQLNQAYTDKSMEILKTDLVEVSAHRGARNIGVGFRNHESWQGKIYRWSAYPRTSRGNYPDFAITCGLGDVQGILGANCRHSYFPFVEGVNEPTYSQADLDKLKATKFTYQGKEYDTYTATQQQRKIERTIRKEKCRLAAATNDADRMASRAKIRALYEEYANFSHAAGLRQQRERANVNVSEG